MMPQALMQMKITNMETNDMVEWKKLGEVFETRNGYTPSTKDDGFWVGGTIPWFKMDDIRDCGTILSDSKLHVTEKAIKGKGLFKANSIILATSATIGEHALITIEHLCNQRFTNFYPKEGFAKSINMKYIYYYMFLIDKWCQQHTHQGGFASVDMDGLYKLPIPIPSISEQTRIVGILDTFTASIENLKQQIAQRRKQYEHYRDQLLDLEGKEGVEMKRLGEVCDKISAGKNKVKNKTGQYPVFGSTGIIAYTNSYVYDTARILVARVGANAGFVYESYGKYDVTDNTLIVFLKDGICQKYVFHRLVRENINKYAKGGGQPLITASLLKDITIIVPSLPEQRRIVSILDTFEASIANLEQQLAQRERQYEYYRNKLLTFE